jgi:hypothetical protein
MRVYLSFIMENFRIQKGAYFRVLAAALLGSEGRGPGEYSRVADFVFNGRSREVYILP